MNFVKNNIPAIPPAVNNRENGSLFRRGEEDAHPDKSYSGAPSISLLGEVGGKVNKGASKQLSKYIYWHQGERRIPDPLTVAPAVITAELFSSSFGCISC